MRDRQEGKTFQASDGKVCHRFEKHCVDYLRGSCWSSSGAKTLVVLVGVLNSSWSSSERLLFTEWSQGAGRGREGEGCRGSKGMNPDSD